MIEFDDLDLDVSKYFDGDSTGLEFDLNDFNIDILDEEENRIKKPTFNKNAVTVSYESALKLVKRVTLQPGEQIHALVTGNFIFGDFLEALLVKRQVIVKQMYISTLSLSQENIDSLKTLLMKGYIKKLVLMVSNYWYSHERRGLLPYLLKELDYKNKFQFVVCRNHTKIILMDVPGGKVIMSGSANLRSSKNDEMFIIQESPELYDFYLEFFKTKIDKYGIINHNIPVKKKTTRRSA